MLKNLFFIVAVISLTACGTGFGGGSSSGYCKEITPPIEGGISKTEVTLDSGEKFYQYRETHESNENGLTQTLRVELSDVKYEYYSKVEFFIKNHYTHSTKRVITSTVTGMGEQTTTEVFSPYSDRLPWDEACKGATWEDTFTVQLSSSLDSNKEKITRKITTKFKVENLDIEKTVKAGTFDTYIIAALLTNKDLVTNRKWIDMDTGAIVYEEGYDASGKVTRSSELIEYTD